MRRLLLTAGVALLLGGSAANALRLPTAPHDLSRDEPVEPARRPTAGRRELRNADRVDGRVDRVASRLRLGALRRTADRHPLRRRLEEDPALTTDVRLRRRVGQGRVSD